jgi:hypothetical protein
MLSQRMAKAAAFAHHGIDAERHLGMMLKAHDLFDRTLTGLRHGDAEQGLTPEKTAHVIASIEAVEDLWQGYGEAIRMAARAGRATALRSGPSPASIFRCSRP